MKTDTEIRVLGMRALVRALGVVEAERFVALLLREPFDYSEWRNNLWPGLDVDALARDACAGSGAPARVAEKREAYGAGTNRPRQAKQKKSDSTPRAR